MLTGPRRAVRDSRDDVVPIVPADDALGLRMIRYRQETEDASALQTAFSDLLAISRCSGVSGCSGRNNPREGNFGET